MYSNIYNKLLVTLDGSQLAESALAYTDKLAHTMSLEQVVLLRVVESGGSRELRRADRYLQRCAKKLAQDQFAYPHGIQCLSFPARMGEAPEAILRFAEQQDFDLIMMATHGRSGIHRWSIGSVAEKVLRATDIPVFLVPAAEGDSLMPADLKRVLVPLDGSDAAEQALPYLEQLTSRGQMAEVALLCVVPAKNPSPSSESSKHSEIDPHTYLGLISDGLVGAGANLVTEVVRSGRPTEQIIQAATQNPIDLIVISEQGHQNVAGWEFGNVADQVLHSSPVPILFVPNPVSWVASPNSPGPREYCCHKCGRRTYRQTFSPQDRCGRCHENLKSRRNCIHFDGTECTLPLLKPKEKSPCSLCQDFEFHKMQPALR